MTIKAFEIDWEGTKAVVKYEDDLPFGEIESIMTSCVDMGNINDVKVNIPQYRSMIFLRTLREAPFKVGDASTLRSLKSSVVEQIFKGVMADFPLTLLLDRWVKTIVGNSDGEENTTKYITS